MDLGIWASQRCQGPYGALDRGSMFVTVFLSCPTMQCTCSLFLALCSSGCSSGASLLVPHCPTIMIAPSCSASNSLHLYSIFHWYFTFFICVAHNCSWSPLATQIWNTRINHTLYTKKRSMDTQNISCPLIARGLCHRETHDTALHWELQTHLYVPAQIPLWTEPNQVAMGLCQILWVYSYFPIIFY